MLIPYITKSRLPQSLRWALRFSDLEACLVPLVDEVLYLDVLFANHDHDYAAGAGLGPKTPSVPGDLNLLTLRHRPDLVPFGSNRPLPAKVPLIEAFIWAIPREGDLAQQVHRELVREALAPELASLAAAGLLREHWVVQLRAVPKPARLELLRTRWTGIRREQTTRRAVALLPPGD